MQTCKQSQYSRPFLFFSFVSGKCGKFISSFLVIALFITGFTISSSASSQTTVSIRSMNITWFNLNTSYSGTTFGSRNISGTIFTTLQCSNGNFYGSGDLHLTQTIGLANITPETRYRISFKYCIPISITYELTCEMGTNGTYSIAYDNTGRNGAVYDCNFTFVLHGTSSNTNTIRIFISVPDSVASTYQICLTDITLTDLDDNSGLLQSILDWLSRIYHSIAGGTDSQGVSHSGLVQGISNAISNISTWLSNLGTAINNKLEAVKTALKNAIDSIQGWLVSLGEDILEGLESLFIPSDTFINNWKSGMDSFMLQHFGAIYQMPQIFGNFMQKLATIDTGDGVIHIPAIQFTWQGEVRTLIPAQDYSFNWVNDNSHPLHYIYGFYRTFAYMILFIGMGNYCINKYNKLFGGVSDDS